MKKPKPGVPPVLPFRYPKFYSLRMTKPNVAKTRWKIRMTGLALLAAGIWCGAEIAGSHILARPANFYYPLKTAAIVGIALVLLGFMLSTPPRSSEAKIGPPGNMDKILGVVMIVHGSSLLIAMLQQLARIWRLYVPWAMPG